MLKLVKLITQPWLLTTLYFDLGGDDAPEPDPAIGKAAAAQAALSKEQLDWYKQIYASDVAPRQAAQDELTSRVVEASLADAAAQRTRSDEQYNFWKDNYQPLEQRSVAEAMDAGNAADQARAAGRSVSDVRQQTAVNQAMTDRNLASMGVNPNSAKFASANRSAGLGTAALSAGAANTARENARDKGIALRAGAVSTGRGMQNIAGQTIGQANGMGTNAAGVGANNVGSGLSSAGFMGAGFAGAANTNASAGNMMNQAYSNQLGAWNASQNSGSGLITGLANLGMAAGSMGAKLPFSDIRLKENVKHLGRENGHNIFAFDYTEASGLPRGRFIGVIAQEIEATNPEAVTRDSNGFLKVDYDLIGVQMRTAQ